MSPIHAVILGLVEGITEYLPVSSTGHLILTAWLLGLDQPPERKAAVDAFVIILQGGAILAVLGLYRERVAQMIRGLLGRDAAGRRLAINIAIAFLPAAVLGVLLDKTIERHLFQPVPVIAALFLGGVLLVGIKRWQDRAFARDAALAATAAPSSPGANAAGATAVGTPGAPSSSRASTDARASGGLAPTPIESLTWSGALLIGVFQCVAMWPGTSRSMMSIVGGMLAGLRPKDAAEFSFLLGLPTLGGACVYKLAKVLRHDGLGFVDALGGWTPVLLGIVVATISAAIAIKWFVGYISRHSMALFGWYRIALAIVLAIMVWRSGLTFGA
ncbi:MAG: undecaprenyl-diphosphate phosphatase [Phycisphaerales bacterium]